MRFFEGQRWCLGGKGEVEGRLPARDVCMVMWYPHAGRPSARKSLRYESRVALETSDTERDLHCEAHYVVTYTATWPFALRQENIQTGMANRDEMTTLGKSEQGFRVPSLTLPPCPFHRALSSDCGLSEGPQPTDD